MYVSVISAVQLCISTKMSTPEKVGGQNTGRPLYFKSRGHVPLFPHGYAHDFGVWRPITSQWLKTDLQCPQNIAFQLGPYIWPKPTTQQSHGLFATAGLLVLYCGTSVTAMCESKLDCESFARHHDHIEMSTAREVGLRSLLT